MVKNLVFALFASLIGFSAATVGNSTAARKDGIPEEFASDWKPAFCAIYPAVCPDPEN
jgi:hypothetical protein